MTDVHSEKIRSFNMSRIKGKNTKPEILTRRFLFSKGLRYRLHSKTLPGKPDIVFSRQKKVVFIHGCFWHGHRNCKYFVSPKTKTEWWLNKIAQNKKRDRKNLVQIRKAGWIPIIIWECELKVKKRTKTLDGLFQEIRGTNV